MRNVIIWHWFIKNLVSTWRRNDVDATSLRRTGVITTSCACWEFGPPWPPPNILNLGPTNILNLPTPMICIFLESGKAKAKKVMGPAFYQLYPRYSGSLAPSVPMAIRLWETFTFTLQIIQTYSVCRCASAFFMIIIHFWQYYSIDV